MCAGEKRRSDLSPTMSQMASTVAPRIGHDGTTRHTKLRKSVINVATDPGF